MSSQEHKLWPFKPRFSYILSLIILVTLLIAFTTSKLFYSWPGEELERTILLGILLLSVLPILLRLVDIVIDRGAVVEYKGLKIDFSQVQQIAPSGITIPANIGIAGQPVNDSSKTKILEPLKQSLASDIVIIDLEEGKAWWETRLLVLLAGAVRHEKPGIFIFVGTDGGIPTCFQGWGYARELLSLLLEAHPKYQQIYHSVLAAARQWELVEPQGPNIQPSLPAGMQQSGQVPGLAGNHTYMAFNINTGLPNRLFAEQLLASELGEKIEQNEPPRTINIVRLEELFRPVLQRKCIDETWNSERQLDEFFAQDKAYIPLTHNGQYKSLISRFHALNTMIGELVRKK